MSRTETHASTPERSAPGSSPSSRSSRSPWDGHFREDADRHTHRHTIVTSRPTASFGVGRRREGRVVSASPRPESTAKVPVVEALLADLLSAGVVLVADGEQLRARAPTGTLPPALRDALAVRRAEVRALVTTRFRGPGACAVADDGGLTPPCRRMSKCARPSDGRPCLIPATCCACGGSLPPGRRYLCRTCTGKGATRDDHPETEGATRP